MLFFKRGAMFGLDARIALAIFGALSVISGAALYSAIQHSKVVALITESNEIVKAIEAYRLDTGVDLETATSLMLEMKHLWEDSGVAGWNGPYYQGSIDTDSSGQGRVDHPLYDWFTIDMAPDISFDYSPDVGGCSAAANAGESCVFWVVWDEVPTATAKAVEEELDTTLDPANGKVRYSDRTPGTSILYIHSGIRSLKQY